MTATIDSRLSFRPAVEADMPFLLELRRRTMTDHQLASGVQYSEHEQHERVLDRFECAQIILLAGEPAGLLKVARDGAEWHLLQIQIAPEQQRGGLGRWIVQTVIDDARRAGASLRLRVLRANPARRLYERLGFRIVKEGPHAYEMQYRGNENKSNTPEIWNAVDDYFCATLIPVDPVLADALRDSDAAGLPQHNVSPNQGKLLHLLARIQGARKMLELGTLGGYSTIWLARALPEGGRLVSLEANPRAVAVANANVARAGLSHVVDIRPGKAIDTLPVLEREGAAPFDFIFIDADKPGNPQYLEWALKLARPGTVIVGDNVVRNGAVADPGSTDPNVIGVRRFFDLMAANPRLSATAIQTVGSKGYDGFSLAIVSA